MTADDFRAYRFIDIRVGRSEYRDSLFADRTGQVGYAAVVSDVGIRCRQQLHDLFDIQRKDHFAGVV